MRPNKTEVIPPASWARATRHPWELLKRVVRSALYLTSIMVLTAAAALSAPAEDERVTVGKIVAQIQKADYEGDRVALRQLYGNLEPFTADEKLASRVRFWRGFALWRRAINGFNDSADPKDLERDLTQAIGEFKESAAKDPAFVGANVGTISCLGYLVYPSQGNAVRAQELIAQSSPPSLRKREQPIPKICVYSGSLVPFCGISLRSAVAAKTKRRKPTKRD